MKKIPTVLVRNPDDRAHVTDEINPGCEWVLAGEGVATRKYDGTCVMLDNEGKWWARREVKPGKTAPANFVPDNFDEVTGKTQGWEPIEQSPFVKFHMQALWDIRENFGTSAADHVGVGTYELCGPKINGNPEHYDRHVLVSHANAEVIDLAEDGDPPWTVAEIKHMAQWCAERGWEGIVWHHPDGRMAKLKARDLA